MISIIKQIAVSEKRIGVLIGENGKNKKRVEEMTKTLIKINENIVSIKSDDGLNLLLTENIIRAISRGFSVDEALTLLSEDNTLNIITLKAKKNSLINVKSRVIGKDGKAKKNLERLTDTHICVFGKTVSILGKIKNVALCAEAIKKLIKGNKHATVYKFLEKNQGVIRA